jgi:uncharacterized protein YbaP (TraB family)
MAPVIRNALFVLMLLAGAVQAAEKACPPEPAKPTPEAMQQAMKHATDHGYMWRISKDGHTSYLYGTMHVGKLEWVFPGPKMMEALRAADTVALELDILDPDIQARTQKAIETQQGGAPLPAALAKRVRQQAEALCVPYDKLAKTAPEMQVALLELMAGRWEGLDAAYAVDAVLAGVGHGAEKEVVSLETPESQMQALTMKTQKETEEYVGENLEELESGKVRKITKRLSDAWAHSDYAVMEHYQDWCECEKTEAERAMMKRMLEERNPAMAEKIDALHHSGKTVFAAVGSLHMFGAVGLPALMEKRGYKVERVELAVKKD